MEDPFHDDGGGIIANMDLVRREDLTTVEEVAMANVDEDIMDKDSDGAEPVILSPVRINRTAAILNDSGSEGQR